MKTLNRCLFALHMFVGIGAIVGGLAAIINPQEPFGVSVEALKNSPFDSYLIPGIILFTIMGLGNLFSAATIPFKVRFQGYISSIISWALVIWIIVQCVMLNAIHALHIIFFAIGITKAALSMVIVFNQRLYPVNLMIDIYNKVRKEM